MSYRQKPNKDNHQKEINALNDQIEVLKKKQAALQATIGSTENIKGNYDGKIDDLKAKLEALAKERTEVNNERNQKVETLKALKAGIRKKTEDSKNAKKAVDSIADIEARIKSLEKQVEAGSIKTISDEKRAISEISSLKKQRKAFESAQAGTSSSTIEADKAQADVLSAELDALKERKDAINKEYDSIKEQLNTNRDGKKGDMTAFKALLDQKKALKAELDAVFETLRATKDKFKRDNDEWFEATKAERVKREQEKEEEQKKYLSDRAQKAAESALESADIPAYTDEINTCNSLIAFLAQYSTSGKVAANAAEATTSAFATNIRKVDSALPDGAVALKKKDDREEEFFLGGKKGKGKKAPSTPSAPAAKTLKIDLVTLELFGKLKLDIPVSAGANVDASIAALEEKKAAFIAEQAAQTIKNKAAIEARVAELKAAAEAGDKNALHALEDGTDIVVEDI
ncbi:UNVERIFIED_CONTAM: hypothetical protein HDU68_000083 [Siphonaria sp. JEL0065]|nr:hypothetical protein HDU68_000083 [Siphonaria sp. JEL0065]